MWLWLLLLVKCSAGVYVLYRARDFDNAVYVRVLDGDPEVLLYNEYGMVGGGVRPKNGRLEVSSSGEYYVRGRSGEESNRVYVSEEDVLRAQVSRRTERPQYRDHQLRTWDHGSVDRFYLEVESDEQLDGRDFVYLEDFGMWRSREVLSKWEVEQCASEFDAMPSTRSVLLRPEYNNYGDDDDDLNYSEPYNPFTASRRAGSTPSFSSRQENYLGDNGINYYAFQSATGGEYKGQSTSVHVVDSGLVVGHEDLGNVEVVTNGECPVNVCSAGDSKCKEPCQHGTACMGLIGATVNGFGIDGIAPRAKLYYHQDMMDPSSLNLAKRGDVVTISMSLLDGVPLFMDPSYKVVFGKLLERGVIVLCSAANTGKDISQHVPDSKDRTLDNMILVGSGNRNGTKMYFSNYGSRFSRVYTLGRDITTTGYGKLQNSERPEKRYTDKYSGTSASAPIVAGALAVMQDYCMRKYGFFLSPNEIVGILETMAAYDSAPSHKIGARMDMMTMKSYVDKLA